MNIIVFGTGDTAQLADWYAKRAGHVVVAFTVDRNFVKEDKFLERPVVPFDEIDRKFGIDNGMMMGISGFDCLFRKHKFIEAKKKGYHFPNIIDKNAVIYGTIEGDGNWIMENNVIQPFTTIGNNNIFWSGNHIGHHSEIKDHIFISSHVVICGHCVINDCCWIGVNSSIGNNTELSEGVFVAMNSGVTPKYKTNPRGKYRGFPAKYYGDVT